MSAPADLVACRVPAEWEPHAATLMIWPERADNWRDGARPAQAAFASVAKTIARFEPVVMVASPATTESARAAFGPDIRIVTIPTDDSWARDTGPIIVETRHGSLRAVDFPFNAWGGTEHGLYAPWDRDDAFAARIAAEIGLESIRAPCVLEGGAIHVDGEGTALVTESCLLDPARNPGVTRARMEQWLNQFLGVTTTIWLGNGVPDDETGGHVDNLACFTAPGRVLLTWCDDPADPHHEVSQDALCRLEAARDAAGRRLAIDRLPMPPPMHIADIEAAGVVPGAGGMNRRSGHRLAASYVNFYICNGAVIAPAFGTQADEAAHAILARHFPDRDIVMLPAREILLGGGNIHCITRQIPKEN